MPSGDRTGPSGFGPLTGRGAGFCAGYRVPGSFNPPPYYGRGRGWGFRAGYGAAPQWAAPKYPPPIGDEEGYLKEEIQYLKDQLQEMEKRLQGLKKGD